MSKNAVKGIFYETITNQKQINCLAESLGGCSGETIKSHGLQKSGILSKLISNHKEKVYTLKQDPFDFNFQSKHIASASTFPGFCSTHDAGIFHDIELKKYEGSSKEHFLYAFRCNSHMYYQKINDYFQKNILDEKAVSKLENIDLSAFGGKTLDGDAIITVDDITRKQREMTKNLKKENWDSIQTQVFHINCDFNFTGSFRGTLGDMHHPSFSYDKESQKAEVLNLMKYGYMGMTDYQLKKSMRKEPITPVYITAIPNGSITSILFSYETKNKNKLRKTLNFLSTLSEDELKNFFSNLFLEKAFNIFFNEEILKRNKISIGELVEAVNISIESRHIGFDSLGEVSNVLKNHPELYMKKFDMLKKPKINFFI